MEAEQSEAAGRADRVRTARADQDASTGSPDAGQVPDLDADEAQRSSAAPDGDTAVDTDAEAEPGAHETAGAEPDAADDPEAELGPQSEPGTEPDAESDPAAQQVDAKGGRPLSSGIGCAALLLPLVAVLGAILCFAAGILSTVTGCTPNGSALCSANGAWFEFVLPLFISPIIAAAAAIGAVTVRRHRSSWLAVGYGVVFVSIIVGLASASTGSS